MIPVELIGGPEDGQCIDVPEAAIGKVLWARPEDGALYHFYMASECPCCFETAEGRRSCSTGARPASCLTTPPRPS